MKLFEQSLITAIKYHYFHIVIVLLLLLQKTKANIKEESWSAGTKLEERHEQKEQQDSPLSPPQLQKEQGERQRQYSARMFRHHCPKGCFCVPDGVDIHLLVVSCRWPAIHQNSFDAFPRNVTKTISVQCTQSDPRYGEENGEEEYQRKWTEKGRMSNEIGDKIFVGFNELRELRISKCQFEKVSGNAFRGIERLKILEIKQNPRLRLFEAEMFRHLGSLEKFTLTGASIRSMPRNWLCSTPYLQVLNISSNQLSSMADLGFDAEKCTLDHLMILDLSKNRIAEVRNKEHMRPFRSARQIILSNNGLRQISSDFLAETTLIHLDLHGNELNELAFVPGTILHLNLARNRFHKIPKSVENLPSIISLNMAENFLREATVSSTRLTSSSIESLILSKNGLMSIPLTLLNHSIGSIKELDLSTNQISEINPFTMRNLSSLKLLDLSDNKINTLEVGTFDDLQELNILLLNKNSIRSIDPEVFDQLKSIHTLKLRGNSLFEMPVAIEKIDKLKWLDLSSNKILKLHKFVFNKLSNLNRLDLSGNKLQSLDSNVFSECGHLTELILGYNQIREISANAFEKCPQLRRIDLSRNWLNGLNNALSSLHSLEFLNISNNRLRELKWNEFPIDLARLIADGNEIKVISNSEKDRKTKRLEVQNNQLETLNTNNIPLTLEELNIANNSLHVLPNGGFPDRPNLKLVNIRHNKLRSIPRALFEQTVIANSPFGRLFLAGNPLDCSCEMDWIHQQIVVNGNESAKKNPIQMGIDDFGEAECLLTLSQKLQRLAETRPKDFLCQYHAVCESGCICCEYGECDCHSKCPDGCRCFHDSGFETNIVRCDGTESKSSTPPNFRNIPAHASHIYLSNLNIPLLASNDFAGRLNLVELHLNNSNLMIIQPRAFEALPKLKILHLAGNQIQRINGDEASRTEFVEELNLAENSIRSLDLSLVEMMPRVIRLYLDYNSLRTVPEYLVKTIVGQQIKEIRIGGNKFRCNCSVDGRFSETLEWIYANQHKVADIDEVLCVENVTRAFLENDTTILSMQPPNVGRDIFTIKMTDFIREEKTFCSIGPNGIFGGLPGNSNILFVLLAVILISMCLLVFLAIFASKGKRKNGKGRQYNPIPTDSTNIGDSIRTGQHSPVTSTLASGVFVCCSEKDEDSPNVQLFLYGRLAANFCVYSLQKMKSSMDPSSSPTIRWDDKFELVKWNQMIEKKIEQSHAMIILLTSEFLNTEWNRSEEIRKSVENFVQYGEEKKLIFIVDECSCEMYNMPDDLARLLRRSHKIKWRELSQLMIWNQLLRDLSPPPMQILSPPSHDGSETVYSEMYVAQSDVI